MQKFIAQHDLDVQGYVFVIQGYVAPNDSEVARKELAAGKLLKDVSVRQVAVIYASERYSPENAGVDGAVRYPVDGVEYAYGQRIVLVYPKKLRELEATVLTREPKQMGFGVLVRQKAIGPETS